MRRWSEWSCRRRGAGTRRIGLPDCALGQQRTGTVTLYPERLQLHVGSEADCYERIRVFNERGTLVAAMSVGNDGRVRWMDALHP